MKTAFDHTPTHGETVCPSCGNGKVLRVKAREDAPANLDGVTKQRAVQSAPAAGEALHCPANSVPLVIPEIPMFVGIPFSTL